MKSDHSLRQWMQRLEHAAFRSLTINFEKRCKDCATWQNQKRCSLSSAVWLTKHKAMECRSIAQSSEISMTAVPHKPRIYVPFVFADLW
mmetsp:Transcript_114162/g.179729  ORF Transcript_114162/g.179729 Transcript_114162/m.179729 type:complete len:89 (-) Transcript_114162:250-516(-)